MLYGLMQTLEVMAKHKLVTCKVVFLRLLRICVFPLRLWAQDILSLTEFELMELLNLSQPRVREIRKAAAQSTVPVATTVRCNMFSYFP